MYLLRDKKAMFFVANNNRRAGIFDITQALCCFLEQAAIVFMQIQKLFWVMLA
jgi:hypothetical protein